MIKQSLIQIIINLQLILNTHRINQLNNLIINRTLINKNEMKNPNISKKSLF